MDDHIYSTSQEPTYVPRIVMVATYTQDTQTIQSITSSVSVQTDVITNTTQPRQITSSNQYTQTSPVPTSITYPQHIQTPNTSATSVTDIDDESSIDLDNSDQPLSHLPSRNESSRKRKHHKSSCKQKKKVRFGKDKHKKPKVTTNTITSPESLMIDLTEQETISPNLFQGDKQSLETFSTTSEPLLVTIPDVDVPTLQPMNIQQTSSIPTAFQQMSSQQKAAITNAALINFFGNDSTVSTIMQTVQQTQHQQQTEQNNLGNNTNDIHLISAEQYQQLSHNLPVVVTETEEESGMCNSLDTTQSNDTQTQQQISHTQPPISTSTSTITNATLTTADLDYIRQTYRVPSYYGNSLSYINHRRRGRTHTQTQNKERNYKKKDDN